MRDNRKFKEDIKYDPNKKEIKKAKTTKKGKQLRAKKARRRAIALVLSAGLAIGGIKLGSFLKDRYEEKYVDSIEEMKKFNIKSRDLQITPETYEQAMELCTEIDELEKNGLEDLSNDEFADYFDKISEMSLKLLKEKVSDLTGMRTVDFTLIESTMIGNDSTGTQIKNKERTANIGPVVKSKKVDDAMSYLIRLENLSTEIRYEDVNRDKIENEIKRARGRLEETMTLCLLKEVDRKGNTSITSYLIEKNDLASSKNAEKEEYIEYNN